MSMVSLNNNIGAYLDIDIANGIDIIIAAGTGDATKVTGETIDRKKFYSLVIVIGWVCTLTSTKTLSLALEEQQSDDGSAWDTATVVYAATVVATGSSVTAFVGRTRNDINLQGKKRYVRYNVTPNLSASGTDTASVVAVATKGGAVEEPQS